MSQVQLFSHPDLGELKATIRNGEPWFLAGDVCRALGIKNARDAVNEIGKKLKKQAQRMSVLPTPSFRPQVGNKKQQS